MSGLGEPEPEPERERSLLVVHAQLVRDGEVACAAADALAGKIEPGGFGQHQGADASSMAEFGDDLLGTDLGGAGDDGDDEVIAEACRWIRDLNVANKPSDIHQACVGLTRLVTFTTQSLLNVKLLYCDFEACFCFP